MIGSSPIAILPIAMLPSTINTVVDIPLDTSKILKYNKVLWIDYMSITDWTRVADGVAYDIGILLKVGRGDVLLAYTPSLYDDPNEFIQNVYLAGNIFVTTEHQVVWVKSVKYNSSTFGTDFSADFQGRTSYDLSINSVTLSGEITYNITPDTGVSSSFSNDFSADFQGRTSAIVQPFIEPPRLTLG